MTWPVLLLVLFGALLHASWNALVKSSSDKTLDTALIHVLCSLLALPVCLYVGPPPAESWPYILGSLVVHVGYYFALAGAYRHGELGLTYPLMRGTAPMLVALTSFAFIGEDLTPLAWLGVACISGGVGHYARVVDSPQSHRVCFDQCCADCHLHRHRCQRCAHFRSRSTIHLHVVCIGWLALCHFGFHATQRASLALCSKALACCRRWCMRLHWVLRHCTLGHDRRACGHGGCATRNIGFFCSADWRLVFERSLDSTKNCRDCGHSFWCCRTSFGLVVEDMCTRRSHSWQHKAFQLRPKLSS